MLSIYERGEQEYRYEWKVELIKEALLCAAKKEALGTNYSIWGAGIGNTVKSGK